MAKKNVTSQSADSGGRSTRSAENLSASSASGRQRKKSADAIYRAALSDPDNPPLTKAQLERMRPMSEEHKAIWRKAQAAARGRPPLDNPKQQVTLRLDSDVIEKFKAKGPGWQTRINEALRAAAKIDSRR